MDSSQIQLQSSPQPTNTSVSIETIDHSIQNIVKRWNRRRKWQLLFNCSKQDSLERSPWRTHLAVLLESYPARVVVMLLLLVDLFLTALELSSSSQQEYWYHWVGIWILSLLGLRAVALAISLGGSYFRRPGYVIDGVVVLAALALEAFLEREGGGLLVVASLWRVVRLAESAFEFSNEVLEAQIEEVVFELEEVREEHTRLLGTVIADKDGIIEELHQELEKCRRLQ